jgi:hypothetical protein
MSTKDGPATQQAGEERDKMVDRVPTLVFEDVLAAEASCQIIISENGDSILARKVTSETRALQCLGQMSETTVQQLSQDHYTRDATEQKGKEPQGKIRHRLKIPMA